MLYLKAKDQLEHYEHGMGYNIDYEFPYVHTHDYWEFVFTLHAIEHCLNGESTIVPKHTLMIIRPKDVHCIKAADAKSNPNKEPTLLNVKISCAKLRELMAIYDERAYQHLNDCKVNQLQIDGTASSTMEYYVSFLMRSNNIDENVVLLKSFLLLVINVFHPAIFQSVENKLTLNPEVEDIIIKMRSQKYLASSLSEITADCHYSYMQLTRLFKNETGMTMQEFFSNIKMQYAVSQLELTNRLILDISNDIGITSLSHFNHLFKSKYGISPSQYRNRRRF